jgi:hypothetical protein
VPFSERDAGAAIDGIASADNRVMKLAVTSDLRANY